MKLRKNILELQKYSVPQYESVTKLNQNESPFDLPKRIKEKIFEKLRLLEWNRYPIQEPKVLLESLSKYTKHPEQGILIGNSSNEILQTVFSAICEKGDKIATVIPGFSIYKRLATVMGLELKEIPLSIDYSFDVNKIIEAGNNCKLIVFASPNNPTGTIIEIKKIERIAEKTTGFILIDEAYFEFYQKSAQKLLKKFNKIIIARTFSKAFGLAGVRFGYSLSSPELNSELKKVKLPFSLGFFQQVTAKTSLKHKKLLFQNVKKIIKEREKMTRILKQMNNIEPIDSKANFILFKTKNSSAKYIYKELLKKGVLVRYFENNYLQKALRVTIGNCEENKKFIDSLKKITGGKK